MISKRYLNLHGMDRELIFKSLKEAKKNE
jgi:hypothetical protein